MSNLEKKELIAQRFFRGQVDKYQWVDFGSSYLLSELNAAYLHAQLDNDKEINQNRLEKWMV